MKKSKSKKIKKYTGRFKFNGRRYRTKADKDKAVERFKRKQQKEQEVDIPADFLLADESSYLSDVVRRVKGSKVKLIQGATATNQNFGILTSEYCIELDVKGEGAQDIGWTSKKSPELYGDFSVENCDGGVNDIDTYLPALLGQVMEEYGGDEDDLVQVTITTADTLEPEFYESGWEKIGNIVDIDLSADEDTWFNRWWSSENKSYMYSARDIRMKACFIKNPYKGSRFHRQIHSKKDWKAKKSIIMIKNEDELCLGRCLVVACAIRDKHPKVQQIKEGRKIQTTLTHKLYEDAGIKKEHSSLPVIQKFEEYLDCCISVIDSDNFNNIIYPDIKTDDYIPKDFNIYLLKDGQHFHLVNNTKVAGFFCKDYFCHLCKKTYKCKDKHKCNFKCNICCKVGCEGITTKKKNWISCPDCWRNFPSQECYDNHKLQEEITRGPKKGEMKPSVCDTLFKCKECKKMYHKSKFNMWEHKCGDCWCDNCDCKINEKEGHRCYMMPKKLNKTDENYIYFDFECSQDTGRHTMNYGIAQYHTEDENYEFFTIDEFMEWLIQDKHKGFSVIAHNGRGYDFQLIMEYIYKKTPYKPVVVYAGSKIMIMTIKELRMRFVDSLNFLTMPLASFPKTFGEKELKKGFFPHYFNTEENFYYEGKIPPLRYFGYNGMSSKKREELIKFWVGKRATNYKWRQFDEMKSYCISDVDILKKCCKKFRQIYLDIADIDPFKYTTIASVCMAIYKAHYIYNDYNTELLNTDKEDLQQFKQEVRNKVFEEQKIGIVPFKQQEFIRKSFFGGRTNSIKLKYKFKPGEIGVYSDITSLYPSVNYFDDYPIGHPIEITENFGDPTKYFGFIEAYVIPPKDLYFPVLAEKGEKLIFDLKPKRGVWTTIEMNKAIEKGYKIEKIYKVLHYEKRSNKLFKPYVSKFLKIKQEASGFPDWCKCEEDRQKYIKDYEERQGIKLDYDKIKYNPGMRAIAKLCLNSLWGKFGQRLNMPKNEIISDSNTFNKIMFSDKYTAQKFTMIDDYRMEIRYKNTDDCVKDDYNTNIAVAAFTTSHARLRLYWALEKLNRQVLYHDTDSVVYVYDKNNPNHFRIRNGDLLGEWTDELDGVDMCGTFLGAGPKNYSYETTDGILHTKIKGFTLNYEATQEGKLNHDSMEQMINNRNLGKTEIGAEYKIPLQYTMITRNQETKIMKTKIQDKAYGFCYEKREIQDERDGCIDTLPFGFVKKCACC